MADKTPVRVVFNASNVATGMAEFQSGETVGTEFGGTGLASIGSAGQVLKVNAAGNALEFAAEGDVSITNLVAPTNADLTFTTSGTGNIILDAITVNGTTLSASDSTKITVAEALDVTGALVAATSLNIAGDGATVTGIKDEDNMASDSATKLATQQSIKAYVDSEVGSVSTTAISQLNSNVTVADTGSGTITVTVDASTIGDFTASGLQLGGSGARVTTVLDEDGFDSNSNTSLATQQSIKAYVDAQITAEDLDFQADSGGALSIDLDSETFTFTGGTGIDTSGSGNAVTFAIDSTVATLTGSQTLTNKTISSPTIETPTITGAATIGEITTNSITSNGSNADISIQPSGTGDVVISALRVNGTTLDSSDSSGININENVTIDGNLTVEGTVDFQDQNISNVGSLSLDSISGDADSNTSITFSGSDVITMATGGSTAATFNADQSVTFSGAVGGTSADFDGGVTIDNITIDGTEIDLSSGDLTIDVAGDLILEAGADINVPANIGMTFGDDGEKIEGNGTDLTINASNDLNLTAATDINVPANVGLTFGDDAEKIEGDGTDLTITGNNIKLTATADVIIPSNVGLHFTDANEKIESDGSKLVITSGGTAFNLPTADGASGQALVTDGAGTLSFDTVATTISDDTLATVRNNKSLGTAARTIDSINATFIDSAFYFLVHNDLVNEVISAEMLAVTNNDTASFVGNRRGLESAGGGTVPTLATDVSNGQFRLRATGTSADCKTSFYKVAMSSSTADATRGNTVTTSNTDVDSASESIDTFAHASFRGAKYFISVDNDSKTEMDVVEALVVHDGSDAYIVSYGNNTSGDNPLITLTAAISGDNVVVSAAGSETNLNLTIHKILLKDNMTAESNANQKAFAAVTVSSTATAIDLMDLDDGNGAVYFIVGANGTEGAYSIQEVYTAATPGVPAVAKGPFVSTKGTHQLDFTAEFDTASENSLELFASSTSGGSTTVSGYRISALAG
jgi:hypothetical protein|tara:strand:- start:455 stop:3400 length:2946 start_codon:yes stop_codon:yes gene_type:complete